MGELLVCLVGTHQNKDEGYEFPERGNTYDEQIMFRNARTMILSIIWKYIHFSIRMFIKHITWAKFPLRSKGGEVFSGQPKVPSKPSLP